MTINIVFRGFIQMNISSAVGAIWSSIKGSVASVLDSHRKIASLQATNAELEKRLAKGEAREAESQKQIADYQSKIGEEAIRRVFGSSRF